MRREPPSLELFPGELPEGQPAFWADVERRRNTFRKLLQGANAQLLCAGWRLKREGEWWVCRHPLLPELRSLRLRELVGRALRFEPPEDPEQLPLL